MKHISISIFLTSALVLLSGCSSTVETQDANGLETLQSANLTIEYFTNSESESESPPENREYTLTCFKDGEAGGTYPDPESGCAVLLDSYKGYKAIKDSSRDTCTMIYGGPEKASISGTINNTSIDIELSRTNGCRIAEWDSWNSILDVVIIAQKTDLNNDK